ncbi:MAG: hypothetical protein O3B86_20000, partial [Planctomycetota bacterium]|nr:hypothetical protein [Planctomycetota bacterium]
MPNIAPLFDDWVTGLTSFPGLTLPLGVDPRVLYFFDNSATDPRLIIEWKDVYHRDQIDTSGTPFLKHDA